MANRADRLIEQIQALAAEHQGTIGVAAKHLGTGEEIGFNADDRFPTASTMKSVLLYELYRQADAGQIDPARRIRFERSMLVPGSGVLQDMDPGAELTIKDYATLMIIVSDNTATDVIYDLVGREPVAATLKRLGMNDTHLPLGCWGMLAGLKNLDPNDRSLTYDDLVARLRESQPTLDCQAVAETPDNNLATPRDFVRLHEAIHNREGLSQTAQEAIIDILKRQKFGTIIPEPLPFGVQAAHKTGSLRGVRNDVGLVYAGDTTYAISLMSKGAPDEIASVRLLSRISALVYEHFVGPIPPPAA